jgi:hypothetical protein
MVQRIAFRAAPIVITVGPSPATERARARAEAKAREISPPKTEAIAKTDARSRPERREMTSSASLSRGGGVQPWTGFAIFALGTSASAVAQMVTDKGAEVAVLAALVAAVAALLALPRGDTGKARTTASRRG